MPGEPKKPVIAAKRYDNFIEKNVMGAYKIVLKNIRDELTSTDSILEIATGIGIITFAICRDIKRITSIDISLEMIKIATEKLSEHNNNNIDFQVGDSCDLEYED